NSTNRRLPTSEVHPFRRLEGRPTLGTEAPPDAARCTGLEPRATHARRTDRIPATRRVRPDDQILLDLPEVRPRCIRAPFLQIRARNQASTSSRSLISSIHLGFRS